MSEVKTNKISPATGTAFTLGDSGDTFTVPSGVTLTNNGTATGFSEPAYAANASASTGAVNVDASDNLQFDSGYGSTVTAYGIRAWVDYNGDTNTINASGNISSVTDNATGNFTLNFSTAMPDTYYGLGCWVKDGTTAAANRVCMANSAATLTTSAVQVYVYSAGSSFFDPEKLTICVYR